MQGVRRALSLRKKRWIEGAIASLYLRRVNFPSNFSSHVFQCERHERANP